jgi:hypothetical protein
MELSALTSFEQEMLLRYLLHEMSHPVRLKVMAELPVIYRKMLGYDDTDSVPFKDGIRSLVTSKLSNK